MTNMVPKEFKKSLCIFAGCITLIEAGVWLAASIYFIEVYNCNWDFYDLEKGVSTWSLLYLTFLMGGCKGAAGAQALGYNFTPPAEPARNLQVWMWFYTIASAVWIPACILLIVAASCEVRGSRGAVLYYPWVGFSIVLAILDMAGSIYHLVGLFTTMTSDRFAQFTGSSDWATLTSNSSSDGVVTWLPSLYVTLFFCRFVVLWIFNVFWLFLISKASSAVALYKSKHIQNTLMPAERKKSWRDTFYEGPDPALTEEQPNRNAESRVRNSVNMQRQADVDKPETAKYKTDEFGIPIEELNTPEQREGSYPHKEENSSRSPYQQTGRVFDFTGHPVRSDSHSERWQESTPPMASGVQVPPELNKFEPFSYIAGDQPQLMRRPVSRSNSKAEYPAIPRPDYTIADRRSASLEFVPNRFKVPSPKRPVQSHSSFNTDSSVNSPRSPTTPKIAPTPLKKPQAYPRSSHVPEDPGLEPQIRYITPQAVPSPQKAYIERQSSQSTSYNKQY